MYVAVDLIVYARAKRKTHSSRGPRRTDAAILPNRSAAHFNISPGPSYFIRFRLARRPKRYTSSQLSTEIPFNVCRYRVHVRGRRGVFKSGYKTYFLFVDDKWRFGRVANKTIRNLPEWNTMDYSKKHIRFYVFDTAHV